MNGELLTPSTVAKMLGIARNTLLHWAELKLCPAPVIIGGNYRFKKSEIENWIAKGCPNAFRPQPVKEKIFNEDGEIVDGVGSFSKANISPKKIKGEEYQPPTPSLDKPTGSGKTELPPNSVNPFRKVK